VWTPLAVDTFGVWLWRVLFFGPLFFQQVNLGGCVRLVSLAWLVVGSWQWFCGFLTM